MKYHRMSLFVSALLAMLIVACAPSNSSMGMPPAIAQGEVVGMYQGSTQRLVNLAMEGKGGAELMLQRSTGNIVAYREIYDGMTEFTSTNAKDIKQINTLTGNLARTTDWRGLRNMLTELGYEAVTGAEISAYYTFMQIQNFAQLLRTTFPTVLVLPVGMDTGYYEDAMRAYEGAVK